jgi:hypothetical protein
MASAGRLEAQGKAVVQVQKPPAAEFFLAQGRSAFVLFRTSTSWMKLPTL